MKKTERKKMSRFMARACIVFLAAGLVVITAGAIIKMPTIQYIGVGIALVSFFIRMFGLRCPNCGCSNNLPQWSQSGTMKCRRCSQPLEYDK